MQQESKVKSTTTPLSHSLLQRLPKWYNMIRKEWEHEKPVIQSSSVLVALESRRDSLCNPDSIFVFYGFISSSIFFRHFLIFFLSFSSFLF